MNSNVTGQNEEKKYRTRRDLSISQSPTKAGSIEFRFGCGSERSLLTINQPSVAAWVLMQNQPNLIGYLYVSAAEEFGGDVDSIRILIDTFVTEGVFVEEHYPDNPSEEELMWHRYGWTDAVDFHKSVKDLKFMEGDEEGWMQQLNALGKISNNVDLGIEDPSPGPYRDYPEDMPFVALSGFLSNNSRTQFQDVLFRRRTFRIFDDTLVPFDKFSQLLGWSLGKIEELDFRRAGIHLLKTSPSGGARHPIEAYVVVRNVDELVPGIYHYDVKDHGLRLTRSGDFGDELYDLCHKQARLDRASAVVFFTSRWKRHIWKYRYARSYRMVHFDCAHVVQTFLLTATDLGLRVFLTPAVRDSATEKFLGIEDTFAESVLYAVAVG